MAGSSLLVLIDDIAAVLDDVALMTKMAAKKTAGVLGDDLALNAQQVSGVSADRELPVVWAVGVGSMKNKAILVPSALAMRAQIAMTASLNLLLLNRETRPFRSAEAEVAASRILFQRFISSPEVIDLVWIDLDGLG